MKKSLGKRFLSGVTSGILAVTYALPSNIPSASAEDEDSESCAKTGTAENKQTEKRSAKKRRRIDIKSPQIFLKSILP